MTCPHCAANLARAERLQIERDAAVRDWRLMFEAIQRYHAAGIRAVVPEKYNAMVARKPGEHDKQSVSVD